MAGAHCQKPIDEEEDEAANLRRQNERMRIALNQIAMREPELDTLRFDRAFSLLREVTKLAKDAIKGSR